MKFPDPTPLTDADKEAIMQEAEAGARLVHESIYHRDSKWQALNDRDEQVVLDDRVRRAREYAAWRIGAYERGECRSAW